MNTVSGGTGFSTPDDTNEYLQARDLLESRDWDSGVAALERAAGRGNAHAATYLGYALLPDSSEHSADPEAARAWLVQGLELGDAEAAFQLGLLEDAKANAPAAFEWFKRAASYNHIPAAMRMGYLALHASLSKSQVEEGLEQMVWAADQGHVFAQRDLSTVMFRGLRGKRDVLGAVRLRWRSLVGLFRLFREIPDHELLR